MFPNAIYLSDGLGIRILFINNEDSLITLNNGDVVKRILIGLAGEPQFATCWIESIGNIGGFNVYSQHLSADAGITRLLCVEQNGTLLYKTGLI